MKTCVVVGGGISGMSAAILLAQQQYKVTLIEKSPRLGPLLRGFSRHGFHFETGFHFAGGLEKGGILRNWIRTLGLDLDLDTHLNETEIVCTKHGSYIIPYGEDALVAWCSKYFMSSKEGMEQFLRTITEVYGQSPYMSPYSKTSLSMFSHGNECLMDYLEKLELEEELKRILTSRCMLYGISPHDALRNDFFFITGAYFHSYSGISGGGLAIVKAYEKALTQLGVTVICGKAVTKLNTYTGKRQIRAIVLEDGQAIESDRVIFTGHPQQLKTLIPEGVLRPAYFKHLSSIEETGKPVILYGIADKTVPSLYTWYIVPENGYITGAEDHEPSLCIITGAEQENGKKTCMVMTIAEQQTDENTPDGRLRHAHWKKFMQSKLEAYLVKKLPFFKDHWNCLELSTAQAMQRWIYGSTGSFYGHAHTKNSLSLLPVTRIAGFFLAGQNILFPGMLGCIISAAIAAGFATDSDAILNRFRICAEEL